MDPEINYIPYGRQSITSQDIDAVVGVLKSPFLTQGPVVPAFENAVANKVASRYGVAVNSATSALHISCLALGLGPGDQLWTSPNTFVASSNCGLYCGAQIDFVDICPSTGLMDIEALRLKLSQAKRINKLPKILVPVHFSGASCDMAAISMLAKEYQFAVIEDASHAIGGSYQGNPVGSCRYSDICVFSFHPVKVITTGEGGMAVTNNKDLAERMSMFRSHGITKDPSNYQLPSPAPWSYEQQLLGFNYRVTDIQAALGLSQLNRLEEIVNERNRLRNHYLALAEHLPVRFLEIPKDVFSSVHLAVIRLNQMTPGLHRRVFDYMRESKIGVQLHYSPVHLQPFYRDMGFSLGDFPHAEAYATNAFSLPLYPGLSIENQQHIIGLLEKALNS